MISIFILVSIENVSQYGFKKLKRYSFIGCTWETKEPSKDKDCIQMEDIEHGSLVFLDTHNKTLWLDLRAGVSYPRHLSIHLPACTHTSVLSYSASLFGHCDFPASALLSLLLLEHLSPLSSFLEPTTKLTSVFFCCVIQNTRRVQKKVMSLECSAPSFA